MQSPIAYSHPPGTPTARGAWSTPTGRPGSSPTCSRPRSAVAGLRPTATRISSPVNSRPSARLATTGPSRPSRRAAVIRAPVTTAMPLGLDAARSSSPANGSSRDSRSAPSRTTTSQHPSRLNAWAISTPTAPPPARAAARGLFRAGHRPVIPWSRYRRSRVWLIPEAPVTSFFGRTVHGRSDGYRATPILTYRDPDDHSRERRRAYDGVAARLRRPVGSWPVRLASIPMRGLGLVATQTLSFRPGLAAHGR